jgi:hypothetical protein
VAANWARPAFAGVDDIFETLHSGLTVKLVSTPRHDLKTCKWSDLASDVPDSNPDDFDFIPVLNDAGDEPRFVGLFHAADKLAFSTAIGTEQS